MEPAVSKRLINVDEYYKMAEVGILQPTDRVELVHGEIIEKMSPISSFHSGLVNRLVKIFTQMLSDNEVLSIQNPVRLDEENEPQPDISVLKYREDDYSNAHPTPEDVLLIIEVAHSSLSYDEGVKMPLYASFNIPEYWVVDVEEARIIRYTMPEADGYQNREVFIKGTRLEFLDATIGVDEIFRSITKD